jgi:hypothetical protein
MTHLRKSNHRAIYILVNDILISICKMGMGWSGTQTHYETPNTSQSMRPCRAKCRTTIPTATGHQQRTEAGLATAATPRPTTTAAEIYAAFRGQFVRFAERPRR